MFGSDQTAAHRRATRAHRRRLRETNADDERAERRTDSFALRRYHSNTPPEVKSAIKGEDCATLSQIICHTAVL